MKITSLILAVMLVLAGCTMDQTPSDISAFTNAPKVNAGHRSEHEGCEIKGSGAYNPCRNVTSNRVTAQPVAANSLTQ